MTCEILANYSVNANVNELGDAAGLPDFSFYNVPIRGKTYPIATKYTKCPNNISNCHKIYQMDIPKLYQMAINCINWP
jgi:hypothetical protein